MPKSLKINSRIVAVGFIITGSGVAFECGHAGIAIVGLTLVFAATIERSGDIIASAVRDGCTAIAKAIADKK